MIRRLVLLLPAGALLLLAGVAGAQEVPARAPQGPPRAATPIGAVTRVPYRLTETRHIMVRARLNGHGPYNFIVDTGAPVLFVSAPIARKIGINPGADGWGTFDRLEVEGGAVVEKIQARIEEPFQLTSMNAIGLAGVRLDGVFGYNLLALFKMEIDSRKTSMLWTRVDYEPKLPIVMLRPGEMAPPMQKPGNIAAMENLAKLATALMPKQPDQPAPLGGYLGLEVAAESKGISVRRVLAGSPAARAGVKPGDRLQSLVRGTQPPVTLATLADYEKAAGAVPAGETVHLQLLRGGKSLKLAVTTVGGTF